MRVIYHDADGGEHTTTWPDDIDHSNVQSVTFSGKAYTYAGTQDGASHYRETT